MEITKANFTVDGDSIVFSMPISKVDKEHRTVSGFATLDNIDNQNDLVTAEASIDAFNRWRGNIREGHTTTAVGKALSFEPKKYFDEKVGREYDGIFVRAYISKGAPDTWEKVLDGTLTGFSIGGSVNKSQNVIDKSNGKMRSFRKVTSYDLSELSLVDNPANQLANIVSFQKSADGASEVNGIYKDMTIDNIFYCPDDQIAVYSGDSDSICYKCNEPMKNIGWMESDEENKTAIVEKSIEDFTKTMQTDEKQDDKKYNVTININGATSEEIVEKVKSALIVKGGVQMSDEKNEVQDGAENVVNVEETENIADGEINKSEEGQEADASEGQAAPVSEVGEEQDLDLKKMFSELTETLTGAIDAVKSHTEEVVKEAKDGFDKALSTVDEKVSAFEKKFEEIVAKVDEHAEKLDGVSKSVDVLENNSAMKKSGDLGGSKDEGKENIWKGAFLPVSNLE